MKDGKMCDSPASISAQKRLHTGHCCRSLSEPATRSAEVGSCVCSGKKELSTVSPKLVGQTGETNVASDIR